MHDENEEIKTPKTRGPRMPGGPGMRVAEKPKDFKSAITRLFKELSGFKVLVTIALVLAVFSSILSIFAPSFK